VDYTSRPFGAEPFEHAEIVEAPSVDTLKERLHPYSIMRFADYQAKQDNTTVAIWNSWH